MNDNLMTRQGLRQLEADVRRLQERCESTWVWIAAALARGGSTGDAEHLQACSELELLERRLAALEERLRNAELIEADATDGCVGIGEDVRVRDLASGEIHDYRIVGRGEAEPGSGRISYRSPIGSALLGRRAGDRVVVAAPRGRLRLEVLAAS
jgi:transcription elongation GreA/GreB family factor